MMCIVVNHGYTEWLIARLWKSSISKNSIYKKRMSIICSGKKNMVLCTYIKDNYVSLLFSSEK